MEKKYINPQIILLLFVFLCQMTPVISQEGIRDHQKLSEALRKLNDSYPEVTKLQMLTKTEGQKEIWALEIGRGDTGNHPGIAIVSGVDGNYVAGPEFALRFAEKLLSSGKTDSIRYLLDSITFYILPNVSPDATEQYFSYLKYNRNKNARSTDDDRDGRIDEDPFEDLNNDGYITSVRIMDPKGEWIEHPDDKRIMVKADKNKGEKGAYIVISEGIDNDKDKKFNEDGAGGITFNKNLPFKFEHFKSGSGDYPVSEIETRAVLDYLYDKWNIFAVFTFGPSDNLSQPQPYVKAEAEKQIISGILEGDAEINAYISKKYNELTGEKNNTELSLTNGGFMQWAYFHYGRLSFSTPAFYIPEIKVPPDTLQTGKNGKSSFHAEINFMRWADSVLQEDYFLDWTPVTHPDFVDGQVEIGGFYPYVLKNPPFDMLDSISDTHNKFILWLACQRPVIDIINIRTKNLGKNIFRIEMDVYNRGLLPGLSGIGEKTRWIKKPRISLSLDPDQEIISGRNVQLLDSLPGDSAQHLNWLVRNKGKVRIEAGAPQTGFQSKVVELK